MQAQAVAGEHWSGKDEEGAGGELWLGGDGKNRSVPYP
jgi:hypothetical protein